jgi:hypothetical protein
VVKSSLIIDDFRVNEPEEKSYIDINCDLEGTPPFIHLEVWEHIYRYMSWTSLWQLHFVASFFFHHVADFVSRNNVLHQRLLVHYFTGDFFHRPCAPKWPHIVEFNTPQTRKSLAKAAEWLHDFNIKQITFKNGRPPANSSFYQDKIILACLKNDLYYPLSNAGMTVFKGARTVHLQIMYERNGWVSQNFPALTMDPATHIIHQVDRSAVTLEWKDVECMHLHVSVTTTVDVVREQMDASKPLSIHIVSRSNWRRPTVYIRTDFKTPFHFKFSRGNRWSELPAIRFMYVDTLLKPTILSWKTPAFIKGAVKYETNLFREPVCLEDVPVELYDDGKNRLPTSI